MPVIINEIFYSVQGEGVHQGVPTTFIRLQGCSLVKPCRWCDTGYAQKGNGGKLIAIREVLDQCVQLERRTLRHWLCITGGEPLLQPEGLHELVRVAKTYGFRVSIETNGTIPPPQWWTLVDCWVPDIKCPSAGIREESSLAWFDTRPCDQIKFVVADQEDLDFARKIITKRSYNCNPTILVSPAFPLGASMKQAWMMEVVEFCKELHVRFSLQVHKVVYGDMRGV